MDKKEFAVLAAAIRTYYPKENILPNQQAMELWFQELQDIPYMVAQTGLRKWVSTNKWSPSIAELREFASEVQNGSIPEWGDGWEQVLMAIRRYGMYQENLALESMDEITRTCVKRLGFRNICLSENINHDRANFRMIYEQLQERRKTDNQLSLPVKEIIKQIQTKGVQQIESQAVLKTDQENECTN